MQRRLIILLVGAVLALLLMYLGTHFPLATGLALLCALGVAGMILLRSMLAESRRLSESRASSEETCLRCGHDLGPTPDRCPECGMSVQ